MFHDDRFLAKIDKTPGCQWHVVRGGAHWFTRTHAPQVIERISAFVAKP
jgi:pimeloyl-ACP methyl ester carboxylesterase